MSKLLNTIETSVNENAFAHLLSAIKETATLYRDSTVKVHFDQEITHVYCAVRAGQMFSAYKGTRIPTSDIFKDGLDEELHLVIVKPKSFVSLFGHLSGDIEMMIDYLTKSNYISQIVAVDDDLELNEIGGEKNLVPHIPVDWIEKIIQKDPVLEVALGEKLFAKLKKLSKNKLSDDKLKDVVSVEITDGKVIFRDSRWKTELAECELEDNRFYFQKTYLTQCTSSETNLTFYDKMMLIDDGNFQTIAALELENI